MNPNTAAAAVFGFIVTGALVTANLTSGYALRILIAGAVLTVAAVWLLSKLPATRPTLATRARWCWANTHPRLSCSHRPRR